MVLKAVGKHYPVPLKSIDVQLTVRGFVANVVTTLQYKNTEKNAIEAEFEFPIDDQSAVYQFEAKIEDRVIIAECQEKKQAKQTYKDAVDSGHTAMLLEEDDTSGDIFRCLVGNLAPGSEAVIKFAYVIELRLSPEGAVTFVLPTQLNPRYNPSEAAGGTANPASVSYVAPGDDQPYTFALRAGVYHSGKISSIRSTSDNDEVAVTLSENGCQAQVEVRNFVADHDFCLEVKYEEQYQPHVIIEKGDTSKDGILRQDVMMLNFFPQLDESEFTISNHEFIFVIDRSGSMSGSRIQAAKTALLVLLKSLPPGCYFNIVGFGSTFELLFPDGSREYSADTLRSACHYQASLDARFGGTEILEPLQAIYAKSPMKTHSRQVMLLTDGDVTNSTEVIDLVKKNASNTRVFSFGVGDGASTSLVKGVARAGGGTAEFVRDESQITSLMMKTLKAAMQMTVTDLELKWRLSGSHKLVQIPTKIPPVIYGDPLIVYAINADQSVSDGVVLLKGKAGNTEKPVEFSISVDSTRNISPVDAALPIHRLAAKAQIKQLEDGEKDNSTQNKAQIQLLSIAANIVSRHTSMVGVDLRREKKIVGDMFQRKVPLMTSYRAGTKATDHKSKGGSSKVPLMTSYGAGTKATDHDKSKGGSGFSLLKTARRLGSGSMSLFSSARNRPKMCAAPRAMSYSAYAQDGLETMCAAPSRPSCGSRPTSADRNMSMYCDSDDDDDCASGEFGYGGVPAEAEAAAERASSVYLSVISEQTFIGCWQMNAELARLLSLSLQQLQDSAPLKNGDVWATVLALSLLSLNYAYKKSEWEMIELKAMRWLSRQPLEGYTVDQLLHKVKGMFARDILQPAAE